MSLICVKCGHAVILSDNPDHYCVCHKCGVSDLTDEERAKIEQGLGSKALERRRWSPEGRAI